MIATACFSACSPRVTYVPTLIAAPMLKEKNDIRVSLAPDDAQFAYAITDRWGVSVNGQWTTRWLQRHRDGDFRPNFDTLAGNRRPVEIKRDDETRGSQIEIGAVYNVPFETPGGKPLRLEFMGGYGFGGYRTMDSNFTPLPGSLLRKEDFHISNNFQRAFGQVSIAREREFSEMIFSWRVSLVRFHDMASAPFAWEQRPENRDRFMRLEGKVFPISEPAFTHRFGRRHFQLFYQLRLAHHPLHGHGDDEIQNLDVKSSNYKRNGPPVMLQGFTATCGIIYRTGKWIPGKRPGKFRLFPKPPQRHERD